MNEPTTERRPLRPPSNTAADVLRNLAELYEHYALSDPVGALSYRKAAHMARTEADLVASQDEADLHALDRISSELAGWTDDSGDSGDMLAVIVRLVRETGREVKDSRCAIYADTEGVS